MPSLAVELQRHPGIWRGNQLSRGCPGIASGFAPLDAELPGGGWPGGALTEILPQHEGIGELRILGPALAQLAAQGKFIVWIAPPHLPYAPALAAAGIDLARIVIVKTSRDGDTLWAAEQALRSAACGGVLLWPRAPAFPPVAAPATRGRGRPLPRRAVPSAPGRMRAFTCGAAPRARHAPGRTRRIHPETPRRTDCTADSAACNACVGRRTNTVD